MDNRQKTEKISKEDMEHSGDKRVTGIKVIKRQTQDRRVKSVTKM